MPVILSAPTDDQAFILHDLLRVHDHGHLPGFAELSPDLTRAVLDGLAGFAADVLAPLNASGDDEGCLLENGVVRTPRGFPEAYRAYCDAGWNRLGAAEAFGGAGLPHVMTTAAGEVGAAANPAFMHYPGLTNGALASIARAGDDWMRTHVVPRMVAGDWTGTMCLTEPGCGTDLRLMTSRAVARPDGSYTVTGTKIFISGGDHDLTDNVIHLVLAKLPDATGRYVNDLATVALFMVPKFLVDPDIGAIGARNGVSVGGVEKKMGIRGSATCVLNFDAATGYRLGSTRPGAGSESTSAGMSAMFDMMNYARLATGVMALGNAQAAYARAVAYARERHAGRAGDPARRGAGAADPIIVHPDVRRLLLKQAAFIEGARALTLWVGLLLDHEAAGGEDGREASALAGLLTPVIKAHLSDRAFEAVNAAVQIHGGHGYIRETGMEQAVRDGRIYQLYEGANGIQALDLVARKLPAGRGRAFNALTATIETFLADAVDVPDLAVQTRALSAGLEAMRRTAGMLATRAAGNPDEAGAASVDFLAMTGTVVIGFMWARMGQVALAQLAAGTGDAGFLRRKLVLGRYWAEREMPMVDAWAASAAAGAAGLMALPAEAF